jgi:hypothetical protein
MKEEEPKILEEGESTFMNGTGGAMCGGVISKSLFDSDPWAYMMAWYMEDKWFEKYKALKNAGKDKKATKIFNRHARSAI